MTFSVLLIGNIVFHQSFFQFLFLFLFAFTFILYWFQFSFIVFFVVFFSNLVFHTHFLNSYSVSISRIYYIKSQRRLHYQRLILVGHPPTGSHCSDHGVCSLRRHALLPQVPHNPLLFDTMQYLYLDSMQYLFLDTM